MVKVKYTPSAHLIDARSRRIDEGKFDSISHRSRVRGRNHQICNMIANADQQNRLATRTGVVLPRSQGQGGQPKTLFNGANRPANLNHLPSSHACSLEAISCGCRLDGACRAFMPPEAGARRPIFLRALQSQRISSMMDDMTTPWQNEAVTPRVPVSNTGHCSAPSFASIVATLMTKKLVVEDDELRLRVDAPNETTTIHDVHGAGFILRATS
jgi:hypothetical protein